MQNDVMGRVLEWSTHSHPLQLGLLLCMHTYVTPNIENEPISGDVLLTKQKKNSVKKEIEVKKALNESESTVHAVPTTQPEYSTRCAHHSTRVQYTLCPPLNQSTVHAVPTTQPEYSTRCAHHSTRVQYTV